jgi:hypothetical protein
MASLAHLKHFARRCGHIASEVSDSDGFIPIRALAKKFGTQLLMRPLLVEGMIASSELKNGEIDENRGKHQWSLLIDSETYPLNEDDIERETRFSPLPARFRNTVAHELAHSLAFRATEFGIELPKHPSEKSRREYVRQVERDTEKLSPLLLISDNSLDGYFSPQKEIINAQELSLFQRSLGVSRHVFVNRLNLLDVLDEKHLKTRRNGLQNIAIGIGEWNALGEAVLKVSPLYSRFDGAKVPNLVFQLQRRIEILAKSLFFDAEFVLFGGKQSIVEFVIPAGTPANPSLISLPVRLSVEEVHAKSGANFLYALQRIG